MGETAAVVVLTIALLLPLAAALRCFGCLCDMLAGSVSCGVGII